MTIIGLQLYKFWSSCGQYLQFSLTFGTKWSHVPATLPPKCVRYPFSRKLGESKGGFKVAAERHIPATAGNRNVILESSST